MGGDFVEPFLSRLCKKIEAAQVRPEENEALRCDIQEVYCYIRNRMRRGVEAQRELACMEDLCRKKMLEMEMASASAHSELPLAPADIEYALGEFCDAFDIAAGTGGRRVEFRCSGDGRSLICAPEMLLKGTGFLIRKLMVEGFTAVSIRSQFTADYFLIHLHGGFRRTEKSHPHIQTDRETAAALSTARRHRGNLAHLLNGESVDPIVYIPRCLSATAPPPVLPDFSDYLCSRLSPVYTCLCDLD